MWIALLSFCDRILSLVDDTYSKMWTCLSEYEPQVKLRLLLWFKYLGNISRCVCLNRQKPPRRELKANFAICLRPYRRKFQWRIQSGRPQYPSIFETNSIQSWMTEFKAWRPSWTLWSTAGCRCDAQLTGFYYVCDVLLDQTDCIRLHYKVYCMV